MIETAGTAGAAGVVLQLGGLLEIGLPALLLLAGLALVIMEALAPGAHLIVVGVALLVTGIIGVGAATVGGPLLFLTAPLVLALLTLFVGGVTFYAYREFDLYGGSSKASTSDSDSLKGKTGRVTKRVTTTSGEVKLEGGGFNPYYQARNIDDGEIPEGTQVTVVDPGGGNVVTVASMDASRDPIDRELARDRATKAEEPATDAEDTEVETERN